MHELWQSALNQFRTQFNNQDFDAWIRPIVCTEVNDQEIHLEVPHAFFEEWIRDRYLDTIEETLSALCQRPCTVAFSHRADATQGKEEKTGRTTNHRETEGRPQGHAATS